MSIPQEALLCGGTDGRLFVRPCREPAVLQCLRCQCPLCRTHARPAPSSGGPAAVLCPECFAESQSASSDDADYSDDSGIILSSGTWPAEAEDTLGGDDGGAPFRDEDYAAFDAVSDYDRNADDGDGYDS
jgi:hypothetical protein